MRAGDLNRPIVIEQRVETLDEIGQPINEWQPYLECWADIRTSKGLFSLMGTPEAGEPSANTIAKYSVRVRFDPIINVGMRVNAEGFMLVIKEVRFDLKNRDYCDLVCEAGGAEG